MVYPFRRIPIATLLVIIGAAIPSLGPAKQPRSAGRCVLPPGFAALTSPLHPQPGQPLRVLIVAETPQAEATVVATGPDGYHALTTTARGGPPYFWSLRLDAATTGRHTFRLVGPNDNTLACTRVDVGKKPRVRKKTPAWPVENDWSRAYENIYAAWIELLFDAPPGARPGWLPLHQAFRDAQRNLLYNHLGFGEDGPDGRRAVVAEPDCADLPYYLRAYFAWKLRLPFAYRRCDRGSRTRPPRCGGLQTHARIGPHEKTRPPVQAFSRFLRRDVRAVHSGNGRTAADDDQTDFYPLALTRAAIRPGTIYVDPYGHLLVVARWVPQAGDETGLLYAIDGHPDLSVGRKQFWRGAFMFKEDTADGAGGFKAFRPLVRQDETLRTLTNAEIAQDPQIGNFSVEQYQLGVSGFYQRLERLINPEPLSPTAAYRGRLQALFELIAERVDAVNAGERYMQQTRHQPMEMPEGPRIFETTGPWEDFSTPARDFRLLIAIDDVLAYPDRVLAHPEWFRLGAEETPHAARTAMHTLFADFVSRHTITYPRSDGRPQQLSLADVINRRRALEMAYNPNDCIEIRWGAVGEELAACQRRAPAAQRARMASYRAWFEARQRPPIR